MFRAPAKDRRTDAPVLSAMPRPALDLGNGHAVIGAADTSGGTQLGGFGRAFPDRGDPQRRIKPGGSAWSNASATAWTNRILGGRNLLIFPNLDHRRPGDGLHGQDLLSAVAWTTWRSRAGRSHPGDEDPVLRRLRMDNFLTFWGPAGPGHSRRRRSPRAVPDRFRGVEVGPVERHEPGMGKDHPSGLDELQMRTFWRHWNQLMTGHSLPPRTNAVFDPHLDGRPRRSPEVTVPGALGRSTSARSLEATSLSGWRSRTSSPMKPTSSTPGGSRNGWPCGPRRSHTWCPPPTGPTAIPLTRLVFHPGRPVFAGTAG